MVKAEATPLRLRQSSLYRRRLFKPKKRASHGPVYPFFTPEQGRFSANSMAYVFRKTLSKDGKKQVEGVAYALKRVGSRLQWAIENFLEDPFNDPVFFAKAQNYLKYNIGTGYRQVHACHVPELLKIKVGGPRCWLLLTSSGTKKSGVYKK